MLLKTNKKNKSTKTNCFVVSRNKQVITVLKLWEWNVPLGARVMWTRMTWWYTSPQLPLHIDRLLASSRSTKLHGSLKNDNSLLENKISDF